MQGGGDGSFDLTRDQMHCFRVLSGLMGMHPTEDDVSSVVMAHLTGRNKASYLSTTGILVMFLFHARLLRLVSSLKDFARAQWWLFLFPPRLRVLGIELCLEREADLAEVLIIPATLQVAEALLVSVTRNLTFLLLQKFIQLRL